MLLALLLSFAVAGFAGNVGYKSGATRHAPGIFSLQDNVDWDADENSDTVPYEAPLAEKNGWQQIPPWLQIILTVGIALIIYYGILVLIKQKQRNKDEIVHYKPHGGEPLDQQSGPDPVSQQSPAPHDYRVPPQDRSDGQSRPRPAKKNSSWPIFIILIVVFNIIRQCMGDN